MKAKLLKDLTSLLTIHSDNFVYTNVRAIVWAGNGLKSPSNIELNTGTILSKIYLDEGNEKCLIIDFKGIELQVDHSLNPLFVSMSGVEREVIFLNHDVIDESLHAYSRKHIGTRVQNDYNRDIRHFKTSGNDITKKIPYQNIENEVEKFLNEQVSAWVGKSFKLFDTPKLLNSTPIKATGKFEALNIVSDPKKFLWTCVLMAHSIEIIKEKENISNLRILSVSLNASTLALTVGLLSDLKVNLINQIGPETKIYDQDELDYMKYDKSRNRIKYIYVGDFTISGTEIKVAKAYIDVFSSSLKYAVVIGSLFDAEVFSDCFELFYLVRLDDVNDEAKYSLPTNSLIT